MARFKIKVNDIEIEGKFIFGYVRLEDLEEIAKELYTHQITSASLKPTFAKGKRSLISIKEENQK